MELKQLIAERRPEFGDYQQQHDAQDVLACLLDGLHEDVNKAPYPRPIVEDPCTNDKSDIQIATEAWSGNLKRNNSKIVDIFQFQVRSEVQFPDADDRSLKFEPMMYLTLPVPKPPHAMTVTVLPFEYPEKPPVRRTVQIAKAAGCAGPVPTFRASLQDCLEVFTRREELAEEDRVRCEKTGNVERSLKKLDLWTAPECLIIHLKRFGSDHAYGPLEKVDTFVQAPLDLDLTPWVLGPSEEKQCQYRLYAVVNHSGTLRYGHYTAYGRVGEGPDRQWFLFNDSSVTKANEAQVVSQEAYILFYERVRDAPDMQATEGAASSSA